ncbi:hypothetical protein HDU76_013452, partial [Blyttiomyces sp. JEL0837]
LQQSARAVTDLSRRYVLEVSYEDKKYAIEIHSALLSDFTIELCKQFAWGNEDLQSIEIVHNGIIVTGQGFFENILISNLGANAVAGFVLRSKVLPKPPSTIVEPSVLITSPVHVTSAFGSSNTLLFRWKSGKNIVKQIKEELEARGLRVWFDEEQMRANMYERMAEAVSHSSVIAPVLTVAYSKSVNCKRELSYASDLRKRIEPARALHQNERLDAWAELITAGLIYYDFSDPAKFNENIESLYGSIRSDLNEISTRQQKVSTANEDPLTKWLQPVTFESDFKRYEDDYVPGTRGWAVERVSAWLTNKDSPRLLWLNGGAGLGKSVIAYLVASNLPSNFKLGSVFFCKHDDNAKNNANRIVATIAYNLASKFPELRSHLDLAMADDRGRISRGETSILDMPSTAFKDLVIAGLAKVTNQSTNILIVVDALDEIGKQGDHVRNDFLNVLRFEVEKLPSWVKIFVTSRPEMDIFHVLHGVNSSVLDPDDANNLSDISTFIGYQLSRHLSVDTPLNPEQYASIIQQVTRKTGGVFHYARLACNSLTEKSYVNFEEVMQVVSEFDGGLDSIYSKVLANAFAGGDGNLLLRYQKVIGAIVTAKEPLTQLSIARFVGLTLGEVGGVVLRLQPILIVSNDTVKVLHKSLKDFLSSSDRCKNPLFFIDTTTFEQVLASACLSILQQDLKYNMANLENDNLPLPPNSSASIDPCLSYALRFWIPHVLASTSTSLLPILKSFCSESLLFWIEGMVMLDVFHLELGNKLRSVAKWYERISGTNEVNSDTSTLDAEVALLLEDCARLIWRFKTAISQNPLQLYSVGVTFAPRETTLYQRFGEKFASHNARMFPAELEWGSQLQSFLGHSDRVYSVCFSDDGNMVVSAARDCCIRLWDVASGKEIRRLDGHDSFVFGVCFSPDGERIASASDDKSVIIWDVESGRVLKKLLGHDSWVYSVKFSRDGRSVVSGSGDKSIIVWDVENGVELKKFTGHTGPLESVVFSGDGQRIVSGSGDKTIRVWEVESGTEILRIEGHTSSVDSVNLSPDGKWIVTGSEDRSIGIWDATTGVEVCKLLGHTSTVSSVCFSSDGTQIVSGSGDRTVRVWDVKTGRQILRLKGHTASIASVALSPNGDLVVSGSVDQSVRLWELSRAHEVKVLEGHSDRVSCVEFSKVGRKVASGGYDRSVRLWDLESGNPLGVLEGHQDEVYSLSFSPDGKYIASGSGDKTVRVWDVESRKEIRKWVTRPSSPTTIAFSKDGSRVMAWAFDESFRMWDLKSSEEVKPSGHVPAAPIPLTEEGTDKGKMGAIFSHLSAVGNIDRVDWIEDGKQKVIAFLIGNSFAVLRQQDVN